MSNKERQKLESQEFKDLYSAFLKLRNESEVMKFMRDLMTMKEMESLASRWKAARMLDKKIPYIEIERLTGLSSATIARVSEYLKYGYDGYRLVLDRIKKRK
ncbi:TrpR-like protein YerC/YecD [Candidatus Dojkabacteria bacterium]|nr:TrpR-like protein YerC/YecD [Candidatus Dojkabacteria bacterium]